MTATSIVVIFLLFLTLSHGQSHKFTTREIENNSGLYFEETGKILFYNDMWKIVSNVNLTLYRIELNDNKNIVDRIMNYCEELNQIEIANNVSSKDNEGCGPILYQLTSIMDGIRESDSNCFGKESRLKRDTVSELLLDDWVDDKLVLTNEFEKMYASLRSMRTVIANQTSLLSSTLNLAEKTGSSIKKYVTHKLTYVNSNLSAVKNGSFNIMRVFQLKSTIQDFISYQVVVLNSFAAKQKEFVKIVSLVGQKNPQIPQILPLDTLKSELLTIQDVLMEKGLDLPIKLSSQNFIFFNKLVSPKIEMVNDQIYLYFYIPLISKHSGNNFSLFKVTSSLHKIDDNLYGFVVPNHEFISIDFHKEHYTTLTVDDLGNCNQVTPSAPIICKQNSPMMPTLTSSECEISILNKDVFPINETTNCKVRYIRTNAEIFIKTLEPNSWLVTMPKNTKIRYMCEGKATKEFFIQINGLLTIDPDCKFATDNVAITGHNIFPKSRISGYSEYHYSIKFELDRQSTNKILNDKSISKFISVNSVPQVVNFGENEKLLPLSYSTDDIRTKEHIQELNHTKDLVDVVMFVLLLILGSISTFLIMVAVLSIICPQYRTRKFYRRNVQINLGDSEELRVAFKPLKPSAPTDV